MSVQRVAQIFGWGFIVVAVLGFIMTGTSMDPDPATAPKMLGIFPENLVENVLHLVLGVWGLVASRSWATSKSYAQISGIAYLLLAVLGIPFPTGFGLLPLGGNNVWLHALLGLVLTFAGFTAKERSAARATS